jgi:glycosyltransferase involved in cell wall biosynthesis
MSTPAVSVLVPCFNHGHWIDEAIDSVFAQTVADWEIIVVDDGSTDAATAEKLAAYRRPRTRVVRTENRGLPAARNLAASLATGRFYCALDADDRLARNWFARALATFERDPELAFVSHWVQAFGDEEWEWRPEGCELSDLLVKNVVNSAALIRRDVFDAVGGFDESMRFGCEDWDFWLRVVESGHRGYILPEPFFIYRRTPQSMSRQMTAGDANRIAMEQLFDRHADAFRRHAAEVFVAKDLAMLPVELEIHKLERDHIIHTVPRLTRLREEYAAVRQLIAASGPAAITAGDSHATREREAALQDRATALQQQAEALQAEVRALRASWSWKLTAPVRFVGGFFMK